MEISEIYSLLEESAFSGNLKKHEPMKSHTTMNVGGTCPLFIEPNGTADLVLALRTLTENKVPFFVLGGGSNTILPDSISFAIISTRKIDSAAPVMLQESAGTDGRILTVSAGSTWGTVLSFCRKNFVTGFEPFSGLSGTCGGAVYMNATCFGLTTSDLLLSVSYIDLDDPELSVKKYIKKDSDFSYKKSPFQGQRKIILAASFIAKEGAFDEEIAAGVLEKRKAAGHFNAPSAGSVFKNDASRGIIAGRIIDECGLKGKKIGGAQVAPFHGNIIINPEKNASAADIRSLVDYVNGEVLRQKGIELSEEILFV